MKKLLYMLFALFFIQAHLEAYNGYYSERRRSGRRPRINCIQCCKQRRFVSSECLKYCNGCQQYNDEATAEGRDVP